MTKLFLNEIVEPYSNLNPNIEKIEFSSWDSFDAAGAGAEMIITIGTETLTFDTETLTAYEALYQQLKTLELLGIKLAVDDAFLVSIPLDKDDILDEDGILDDEVEGYENKLVEYSVAEILLENDDTYYHSKEDIRAAIIKQYDMKPEDPKPETSVVETESVNQVFFKRYRELGGSVLSFEVFEKHLNVFFMLTQAAYTGGDSTISREEAFSAWVAYCKGAGLGKKEPRLVFDAVDSAHAYT